MYVQICLPVGLPVDQQLSQRVIFGTFGQLHQDIGPTGDNMLYSNDNNFYYGDDDIKSSW